MDLRTTSSSHRTEMAKAANDPRYLVTIELDGLTLRFVQDNASLNFPASGGSTYYPWGFEFTSIPSGLRGEVGRMTINFDNVNTADYAGNDRNFFRNWVDNYAFQGKLLTVSRVFASALASADDAMVLFAGYCRQPKVDEDTVTLTVDSASAKLQTLFPKRLFSGPCPWAYDGVECLAGKIYTADTVSFTASSNYISDSANGFLDAGYCAGQTITVSGSSLNDGTYTILIATASLLALLGSLADESEGASITLTSSIAAEDTGTAEAGSSATELVDTANRTEADNYWRDGRVTFTSGALNGLSYPIESNDQATGTVTLRRPATAAIGTGVTYTIRRGCDKTGKTCRVRFGNYVNFGGFPAIPDIRGVAI